MLVKMVRTLNVGRFLETRRVILVQFFWDSNERETIFLIEEVKARKTILKKISKWTSIKVKNKKNKNYVETKIKRNLVMRWGLKHQFFFHKMANGHSKRYFLTKVKSECRIVVQVGQDKCKGVSGLLNLFFSKSGGGD